MKARLQQLRQIIMFGRTDQSCNRNGEWDSLSRYLGVLSKYRTWNGDTGQWTATRVQVIEQHTKCIRIKFNDAEFGLGQFGAIDFLSVRAHREPRDRQLA